jgi:hypothetical protein
LAHDFLNQAIDWRNAAFLFAAAEHLGPLYIPRGQISAGGPCTPVRKYDDVLNNR